MTSHRIEEGQDRQQIQRKEQWQIARKYSQSQGPWSRQGKTPASIGTKASMLLQPPRMTPAVLPTSLAADGSRVRKIHELCVQESSLCLL
jgi:hypothetical protein